MAIGLSRAGLAGALAAWVGFTLPSAVALVLFAFGVDSLGNTLGPGWLHGLKVAAVAVVAQAVLGMMRTLAPDRERATLAVVAAAIVLLVPTAWGQIGAIALGAIVGAVLLRAPEAIGHAALPVGVGRSVGVAALVAFAVLLAGLPILSALVPNHALAMVDVFYRAGSLVFGGGHVVLPLLQSVVVQGGVVSNADFLAGYGAAQAVPGPLFTFSAYLGAVMKTPPNGVAGAAISLIAIFLPGILVLIGTLPFWETFRRRANAQAIMRGVNAAVVGLLGAALYNPVWTSAVKTPGDFALALVGFVLLAVWQAPPLVVVAISALGGIGLALAAAG